MKNTAKKGTLIMKPTVWKYDFLGRPTTRQPKNHPTDPSENRHGWL